MTIVVTSCVGSVMLVRLFFASFRLTEQAQPVRGLRHDILAVWKRPWTEADADAESR